MKHYRHVVALLLMLSLLFATASLADSSSDDTKITEMLDRGLSMNDIVVSLENEPETQAFLARYDSNTLTFLQLLCQREVQRRGDVVEEAQLERTTYVVNINTDKFHRIDCKHVEDIKAKNRWDYEGLREDLIKFKYTPCKTCNP